MLHKYMYLAMKSVNNHLLLIQILGGSKSGWGFIETESKVFDFKMKNSNLLTKGNCNKNGIKVSFMPLDYSFYAIGLYIII